MAFLGSAPSLAEKRRLMWESLRRAANVADSANCSHAAHAAASPDDSMEARSNAATPTSELPPKHYPPGHPLHVPLHVLLGVVPSTSDPTLAPQQVHEQGAATTAIQRNLIAGVSSQTRHTPLPPPKPAPQQLAQSGYSTGPVPNATPTSVHKASSSTSHAAGSHPPYSPALASSAIAAGPAAARSPPWVTGANAGGGEHCDGRRLVVDSPFRGAYRPGQPPPIQWDASEYVREKAAEVHNPRISRARSGSSVGSASGNETTDARKYPTGQLRQNTNMSRHSTPDYTLSEHVTRAGSASTRTMSPPNQCTLPAAQLLWRQQHAQHLLAPWQGTFLWKVPHNDVEHRALELTEYRRGDAAGIGIGASADPGRSRARRYPKFKRWLRVVKPYADRPAQLLEFATDAEAGGGGGGNASGLPGIDLSKVIKVVLGGTTHAFQLQRQLLKRQRTQHFALRAAKLAQRGAGLPAGENSLPGNSDADEADFLLPPLDLCFSLVLPDRTFDLAAESTGELRDWMTVLRPLIAQPALVEKPFVPLSSADQQLHQTNTVGQFEISLVDKVGDQASRHAETNSSGSSYPHPVSNAVADSSSTFVSRPRVNTVEQVLYWRSTVFNHARHNRLAEVRSAFDDGCPVDLLEVPEPRDSVLLVACRQGWTGIAELCLRRGANFDPHPDFGLNALQLAVEQNHLSCARLLLEEAAKSGADHEIANLVVEDGTQSAPLHYAAQLPTPEMVKLLLKHGARASVVDSVGRRPLHIACAHDRLKVAELLVRWHAQQQGISLEKTFLLGDHRGDTALHLAVQHGHHSVVCFLLDCKASANVTNTSMLAPLQIARLKKDFACVQTLSPYTDLQNLQGYVRCIMDGEDPISPAPDSTWKASHLRHDAGNVANVDQRAVHGDLDAAGHSGVESHVEGWVQLFTDEGDPYWFHEQSGVSQWEAPTSLQDQEYNNDTATW